MAKILRGYGKQDFDKKNQIAKLDAEKNAQLRVEEKKENT